MITTVSNYAKQQETTFADAFEKSVVQELDDW